MVYHLQQDQGDKLSPAFQRKSKNLVNVIWVELAIGRERRLVENDKLDTECLTKSKLLSG
jgi:hypothetical protein